MNGIRFFAVTWSQSVDLAAGNHTVETTIEAAHSRRYLADLIKQGKINGGKKKYVRIQEIETPLIEMEYYYKLMQGKTSAKEREAHRQSDAYVLQLIRSCAARYMDEEGAVIER